MNLFNCANDKIRLIPMAADQAADIHAYASSPRVKKYIGWPLMTSLEETQAFVETMTGRHEAKTHVYASVQEVVSGKVVGTLMLFGFDWEAGHGEIGYVFHEASWGKGYGSAGTAWLTDYAFEALGLRKLFARVVSANAGSAKVLENNGFELEAVLKDYYFIDGQHSDCLYYSKMAKSSL